MEAVGQLAGGVAHDFNNLLSAISGYTQQARQAMPENHHAIEALRRVEEAADQASGVTRALLTFSHRAPASKEAIDLREPVERAARLLSRIMPASIAMVTNFDTPRTLEVLADSTQIQQIVMNLAINARDAMPKGGTLRIALSAVEPDEGPAEAMLIVSDNGMGIPEGIAERIFEPFFSTKPRSQGTGLGLAITHGIVEDHDGRISMKSIAGKGTTFSVALPLLTDHASSALKEFTPITEKGSGELILLAESNRHVGRIILDALRKLNYQVLWAGDGQSFLQHYDENIDAIQLLLIDAELTQGDGLDCLRAIRARERDTPAIVLTRRIDARVEDAANERMLILRKPFHIAELGDLVGRLIAPNASRRLTDE
jgi:CheY-like chemotaxis protein